MAFMHKGLLLNAAYFDAGCVQPEIMEIIHCPEKFTKRKRIRVTLKLTCFARDIVCLHDFNERAVAHGDTWYFSRYMYF